MKKIIKTDAAPAPVGPYSQAVEVDGMVYLSGQIPLDPKNGNLVLGSIKEQTRQVMTNIEAVLTAAELKFANVIKSTIYLTNMDDFSQVNEVYSEYFGDEPPARSCVAVAALPKGVNVEVEVLAKR